MEPLSYLSLTPREKFTRAFNRFVLETTLLFVLMGLIWYAIHFNEITHLDEVGLGVFSKRPVELVWTPFLIYSGIGFTLLSMIFYGTSFEVTPLRLLLPFLKSQGVLIGISTRNKSEKVNVVSNESGTTKISEETGESNEDQVDHSSAPTKKADDSRNETRWSVDQILRYAADNAEALADKMQNRINLHLGFGVLIAGLGLGVWYMTFYHGLDAKSASPSISGRAFDALPRITILFFIELLAGFFLRQYRIGVEDLKYFLELKRRAEAKQIAFTILYDLNDKSAIKSFANTLLNERSDTRLKENESTTSMLALDKEKNEFIAGLDGVAAHAAKLAKELKKKKTE